MADQKLTELTELAATPTTGDLLAIVDDPTGSPETKKITIDNVANFVADDTMVLTNKTLDANGTGNSITNVDLTADITGTLPVGNGGTGVTASTGTTNVVLSNGPTLVAPLLGTPDSGVMTNVTGTAAGLTAGNVTTNANLTGDVTSVGNATTTVTNANLTGDVTSVGNATTTVTNANLTGDVTSVGNAATLAVIPVIAGTNLTGTAANLTAGAVSTITGLAPDTATTQATQPSITTAAALTTVSTGLTGVLRADTGVLAVDTDVTDLVDNLPITALADGTDGELLTWSAAGAPTTIAAGTATHVLTSNGPDTVATFQAAGGGGLAGTSVVTVGTSGDYTDITAAIAGESTPYQFVLVSDVTEDSNIAVPENEHLFIHLSSYMLDLGEFQFTFTNAGDVMIDGNGRDSGAELQYSHTGTAELFEAAFNVNWVELRNILVDNNSTTSSDLTAGEMVRIYNCRFEIPNVTTGGLSVAGDGSVLDNVEIVGGGTSCVNALVLGGSGRASNIYMSGTFSSSSASVDVKIDAVITNMVWEHQTNGARMDLSGRGSNISAIDQDLWIQMGSGASVSDADLKAGLLALGGNCNVSNIITTGNIDHAATDFNRITNAVCALIDLTDAGSTNGLMTNCKSTSAQSIAGDRHKFNNCDFLGGATVPTGANNNTFTGCQFGVDAGAGALTLTIDATSTGTIAIGCQSDVAIVDNGTGSAVANNVVY